MAFTPSDPVIGDTYILPGGATYEWDGSIWVWQSGGSDNAPATLAPNLPESLEEALAPYTLVASLSDVQGGTNNTKAVTPLTLKDRTDALEALIDAIPTDVDYDDLYLGKLERANNSLRLNGKTEGELLAPYATAATSLSRANHTGTQAQSTIVNLTSDLASKAPLASPSFTGAPSVPTAEANISSLQIANTEYVNARISELLGAAPEAYDTLQEIATILQGAEGDIGTLLTQIATKTDPASLSEVQAGVVTTKAVVPATLAAMITDVYTDILTETYLDTVYLGIADTAVNSAKLNNKTEEELFADYWESVATLETQVATATTAATTATTQAGIASGHASDASDDADATASDLIAVGVIQSDIIARQSDVTTRQADVVTRQSDVTTKQATVAADLVTTQGYRDTTLGYKNDAAASASAANLDKIDASGFADDAESARDETVTLKVSVEEYFNKGFAQSFSEPVRDKALLNRISQQGTHEGTITYISGFEDGDAAGVNELRVTRDSEKYAVKADGTWQKFLANQPAVTDTGNISLEDEETYYPVNSEFEGAVVGTIGSGGALPTGYTVPNVVDLGGTIVIESISDSSYGFKEIVVVLDVTNSSGSTKYPGFLFPPTPAVQGDQVTAALNLQLENLSGDDGLSTILEIQEHQDATYLLSNSSPLSSDATSRQSHSRLLTEASTNLSRMKITTLVGNGQRLHRRYTLRIPTFTKSNGLSTPMPTTATGNVVREADEVVYSPKGVAEITAPGVTVGALTGAGNTWAVEIPSDIAANLNAQLIKLRVGVRTDDAVDLKIAYVDTEGNSGWQTFNPGASWELINFEYEVNTPDNINDLRNPHYLLFWPDSTGGGGAVEINGITISFILNGMTKAVYDSNDDGTVDEADYATTAGNADTATNVAWSGITSKPTTLSGFGITDAMTDTAIASAIQDAVDGLVDGAPGTIDTLNELAAALGDDPNFATTVTNSLASKAPLASPALTGTPTAPTATEDTNTTQLATTAFVETATAPAQLLTDLLTVDGASSGLDADLLDGQHGSYYLPGASYTAADVLSKLLTVDGSGSGVDADLLDGQQGSYYSPIANPVFSGTIGLNAAVGAYKYISYKSGGVARWDVGVYDSTEPGSNVGSDFFVHRFADNGDFLGVVYTINRASGTFNFTAAPTVATNVVWHAGNDGASSGLDADLLDGQHGSYYAPLNAPTFTGKITSAGIAGNMAVSDGSASAEIKNSGGTGDSDMALMSFHCPGSYATKMGLRSDGYFGIGGWSAAAWSWSLNMSNGDMTAAGNIMAYSDKRLKSNIRTIDNALNMVLDMRGVRFRDQSGRTSIGLIAQELQKIAPEVVGESGTSGYLSVAYGNLVGLLVEATKELHDTFQHKIEALSAEIKELKGE